MAWAILSIGEALHVHDVSISALSVCHLTLRKLAVLRSVQTRCGIFYLCAFELLCMHMDMVCPSLHSLYYPTASGG